MVYFLEFDFTRLSFQWVRLVFPGIWSCLDLNTMLNLIFLHDGPWIS